MSEKGLIIILSGPSGSGKGTIVQELIKNKEFILSISATTRTPRQGEQEGIHYFFKTHEEFESMIKNNEFLEYAHFCDNYYGTPKRFIEETIESGKDCILEIEVQGALQVKKNYKEAVFIFIIPPSLEELEKRLVGRNTENHEVIQKRLDRAKEELKLYREYDYVVDNDSVENAVTRILSIICAEKLKSSRSTSKIENILKSQ
jgi:guanylate kinase